MSDTMIATLDQKYVIFGGSLRPDSIRTLVVGDMLPAGRGGSMDAIECI